MEKSANVAANTYSLSSSNDRGPAAADANDTEDKNPQPVAGRAVVSDDVLVPVQLDRPARS